MAPRSSLSSESPLRVALVALPWSRRDRPSAAIAALAAYLRRERPAIGVVCRSEFVEVSERVGAALYDAISSAAYAMVSRAKQPARLPLAS